MNPIRNYKSKGGCMKKLFLLIGLGLGVANANIDIILDEDINFANTQGVLSSSVVYNNQNFQAMGTYRVGKDLRVVFEIDRLIKGQKLSMLDKKPKVTKRLNDANSKLAKGTKLTLKGENKKEFRDFAEQIKSLNNSKSNTNISKGSGSGSNSSGGSGSIGGGSAGSGTSNINSSERLSGTGSRINSGTSTNKPNTGGSGSIGNVSIGNGGSGSGTIQPPYVTPGINTSPSTDSEGNKTTELWSSQFCSVPEFLDNAIRLNVVDKNGDCVEKMAVRDDTKCEYRYDFANNKAIKQTQFYYVDNENKVQNVGDCVDLKGPEYEAELYKDDTRCSLEHTDKDYNGGIGSFFVTQILFRGIDGLIHEATDCIAYGNVEEELVEHILDDKARTAQRVVNQYYIDPYTSEKVYLTKGIRTDAIFSYVETSCGDWEMDDIALEGKKRTEITFYDDVEYKQFNVTSCDFSTQGGKQSQYLMKYTNLSATYKEQELSRRSETYNIQKQTTRYWTTSDSWTCGFKKCNCKGNKWAIDTNKNVNWTTTYVTKDVTDYETYQRPDGSIYQLNKSPQGEKFQRIDREVKINKNDFNLTEDWLLFWEIHNKYYVDKTTEQSNNYQSWLSSKYKKGGSCSVYEVSAPSQLCWDGYEKCVTPLDYDLTNLTEATTIN